MLDLDKIYTPQEAADFLRAQARTLERWRIDGTGPDFVKVGRRVAYTGAALRAFVEQQTRRFTSEAPPTGEREALAMPKPARTLTAAALPRPTRTFTAAKSARQPPPLRPSPRNNSSRRLR